MGKRLIPQRRGKGTPRYRSPKHRSSGPVSYPRIEGTIGGQVIEIHHDRLRRAPIARVMLENFEEINMIAPADLRVGQWITIGEEAKPETGNVLPLNRIPEGTEVYNVELRSGDGGKIIRSPGTAGYVVSHDKNTNMTHIKMPSKRTIPVKSASWATVGKVGGSGHKEKPFLHAGQAYHSKKARGKLYPHVGGVSMNPVDHPHGGGDSVGRSTTVSRNTPPGRKAGHIAARRTGKRKR